jgi:hypothetical protein
MIGLVLGLLCLTPLSAIFQLYRNRGWSGGNRSIRTKTTDLSQVTDKLYHIMLDRVRPAMIGVRTRFLIGINFNLKWTIIFL